MSIKEIPRSDDDGAFDLDAADGEQAAAIGAHWASVSARMREDDLDSEIHAYFRRIRNGCRAAVDAAGEIPGADRALKDRVAIEAVLMALINILAEDERYADVDELHKLGEQIAQQIREKVPQARAYKQSARNWEG